MEEGCSIFGIWMFISFSNWVLIWVSFSDKLDSDSVKKVISGSSNDVSKLDIVWSELSTPVVNLRVDFF